MEKSREWLLYNAVLAWLHNYDGYDGLYHIYHIHKDLYHACSIREILHDKMNADKLDI